jgi:hypothetical protein
VGPHPHKHTNYTSIFDFSFHLFIFGYHKNFTKYFQVSQLLKLNSKHQFVRWFSRLTIHQNIGVERCRRCTFCPNTAPHFFLDSSIISHSSEASIYFLKLSFDFPFLCGLLGPLNSNLTPEHFSLQVHSIEAFYPVSSSLIFLKNIFIYPLTLSPTNHLSLQLIITLHKVTPKVVCAMIHN